MNQSSLQRSLILGLAILAMAIFQGCPEPEILLPGTISGIVTNRQFAQEPISGATISISGINEQKVTGSDGRFEFMVESILEGYTLQYSHPEFETDENADIKVEPGGVKMADIALNPIVPITLNVNQLNFGETISEGAFTITSNRTSTSGDLNFSITTTSEFIVVAPSSGVIGAQNTEAISVEIDRAFLNVGPLAEQIIINVPNRGSALLDVVGTIAEPPEPGLGVEVSTLDFGANEVSRSFQIENTGGDTVRWNIVENIPWATVTPNSGILTNQPEQIVVTVDRNGFNPGDYSQTLTVNSDAGSEEVVLTMTINGSLLQISPSSLSFGVESVEESLSLTRVGQGTLNYEIQSDRSWLTVSPSSGSVTNETDFIIVRADRTGLEFGNFEARLAFNTDNGTQIVTATITVPDPNAPQLTIDPASVNMGQDVASTVLSIQNTGQGRLVWSASKSSSWLTTSKNTGELGRGELENITLTVNRSELTPDSYEDVLRFTSNGGAQNVPVEIEVANRPVLSVDQETLEFGRDETGLSFSIGNIGNGEMTWSVATNQDWISLNPTTGTNSGTVNVTVTRDDLPFGSYSGQVDVASDGGVDVVLIEMDVLPPNVAPVADFTLSSTIVNIDQTVEFDASVSTDEEDRTEELEVRWRFSTNGSFTEWRQAKRAIQTYTTQGIKQVTLEVRDTEGATSSITKEVQVIENQPPNAVFSVDPGSGKVGETTFTVDATGSNDDIDPTENLQYRWRWEDGQSFTTWLTDKTNTHVYGTTGEKIITLEVLDSFGEIGSTSQAVNVTEDLTEVEENASLNEANELPFGVNLSGEVGVDNDQEDWFRIRATSNGSIQCFLRNTGDGDNSNLAGLIVYDEDLNVLQTIYTDRVQSCCGNDAIAPNSTARTSKIIISEGVSYFIRVAEFSEANSSTYVLSANFEEFMSTDIGEPNNTRSDASIMAVGASQLATVGFGQDAADWYSIAPTKNGILKITFENLQSSGELFGRTGLVSFFNSDQSLLTSFGPSRFVACCANDGFGPTTSDVSVKMLVQSGEEYFIRILPFSGLDAAAYRLQTSFDETDAVDTAEPNDVRSQAITLMPNEASVGTIGFQEDEIDWYVIQPVSDGTLQLSAENLNPSGIQFGNLSLVRLFDENNTLLTSFGPSRISACCSNDAFVPGASANSSIISVSGGMNYFISVSPFGSLDGVEYSLQANPEALQNEDFGESNNDKSEASMINFNEVTTATIGFGNDKEDWYQLTPTENGKLEVIVENLAESGVVFARLALVTVFDDESNVIASFGPSRISACCSNDGFNPGTTGRSATVDVLADENYFIQVTPFGTLDGVAYRLETVFN